MSNPHIKQVHWPELDVLRGLAACLMVANHSGYAWLAPDQVNAQPASFLVFLGSFAPALFFFVTGLGYGVQLQRSIQSHSAGLFTKVAVLFAIEAVPRITAGQSLLAIDFLGFIAFTMLVLELVRYRQNPALWAVFVLNLVILGRYVLGPVLRSVGAPDPILSIVGLREIGGVSFPLFPWLAYPLVGLLVGRYVSRNQSSPRRVAGVLLAMGVGVSAVSAMMSAVGMIMFRWGTVSLAFFVAGLGMCGAALGVLLLVQGRAAHITKLISLRGVSCLAVVPVHYQLLRLGQTVFGHSLTSTGYVAVLPMAIAVSISLSNGVARLGRCFQGLPYGRAALALAAVICTVGSVYASGVTNALGSLLGGVAEVILCLTLAVSPSGNRRTSVSDQHARKPELVGR